MVPEDLAFTPLEVVERLARARIGATYNQYARSELRRARLRTHLEERAHAGRRARRRGGRLPRRAGQRRSVHLGATADRHADPRRRPRRSCTACLRELGIENDVLLWNVVPTHPGTATSNRRPTRAEVAPHGRSSTSSRAAAASSPSGACSGVARRAVRPPPVARRRACVRRGAAAYTRPVRNEVRRNAFLLAACLVCNSAAFQLAAALSSLTLVAVTGIKGILGLGPAIFLTAGALAVGPAGRLMDRVGRMPVIRGGVRRRRHRVRRRSRPAAALSAFLVCLGLALVGGSGAVVQLVTRGGRRDVPARAPRARHVVRALRRGLRRALGAARLRPALRASRRRRARARRSLAGRRPVHARRLRDRVVRAPRPEGDLRELPAGRARRLGAGRPAARDRAPAWRVGRARRGGRELRRDGLHDEPRGLRRRRSRPSPGRRLHDDQHPHPRDVRAGADRGRSDRPLRPPPGARDRARADDGLERRAHLDRTGSEA